MQIFPTRMSNVTAWRHSRLRSHWLMTLVAWSWGEIPRELQRLLSLFCLWQHWRSLWAELNDGENSLHWKANMLSLFTIMTLWYMYIRRQNDDVSNIPKQSESWWIIIYLNNFFRVLIWKNTCVPNQIFSWELSGIKVGRPAIYSSSWAHGWHMLRLLRETSHNVAHNNL